MCGNIIDSEFGKVTTYKLYVQRERTNEIKTLRSFMGGAPHVVWLN